MIKIIDKQNRKTLNEGRNFQMGFAFCKKLPTKRVESYQTVQPISPCKDYLNDVVWTEHTGNPINACGLNYKKNNIFNKKVSYIVISIMPYFNGNMYHNQTKDTENLENNIDNLIKFINFFDEKLGAKVLTTITKIEDNKYLVKFDYKWSKYTYAISLFALLLRVGQFYKNDVGPLVFLKNFKEFLQDVYLVNNSLPKLDILLDKGFVKQNLKKLPLYSVHNCGILGFKMD